MQSIHSTNRNLGRVIMAIRSLLEPRSTFMGYLQWVQLQHIIPNGKRMRADSGNSAKKNDFLIRCKTSYNIIITYYMLFILLNPRGGTMRPLIFVCK